MSVHNPLQNYISEEEAAYSPTDILRAWLVYNAKSERDETEGNQLLQQLSGCFVLEVADHNNKGKWGKVILIQNYKRFWNYISMTPVDSFGRFAILQQVALVYFFAPQTVTFTWRLACFVMLTEMVLTLLGETDIIFFIFNFCYIFFFYSLYRSCCLVYKNQSDQHILNPYLPRHKEDQGGTERQKEFVKWASIASNRLYDRAHYYPFNQLLGIFVTSLTVELSILCFGVSPYELTTNHDDYVGSSCSGSGGRNQTTSGDVTKRKNGRANVNDNSGTISGVDGTGTDNDFNSMEAQSISSVAFTTTSIPNLLSRSSSGLVGCGVKPASKTQTEQEEEVKIRLGCPQYVSTADFCRELMDERTGNSTRQCSYYQLLNMGTRYLERYSPKQFWVDNKGSYVFVFLLFFSVTCYIIQWLFDILTASCLWGHHVKGLSRDEESVSCYHQGVVVVVSLAFIPNYVFFLHVTVTIAISLVGLYYGAVVIHGLASCWVNRYSGLRSFTVDRGHDTHREKNTDIDVGINDDDDDDMHTKVYRGNSEQSYTRRNDHVEDGQSGVEDSYISIGTETDQRHYPKALLLHRIEKDAYEHYLFIHEFVYQVSESWSFLVPFVVSVSFCLTLMLMYFLLFKIAGGLYVYSVSMAAMIFLILATFPIYCLAHANSSMETIRECFITHAAPNDYQVLGGREKWVRYLEKTPAYWTVFGAPITWRLLYSVGGTLFGFFVAGTLAFISRTN